MTRHLLPLVLLSLTLSACAEEAARPATPATLPFEAVLDIRQTMVWILDPAVDVIWDSAGTILTAEGSTELTPTTAAGWDDVVQAAATLAEAGNLLMLPGRAAGEDWVNHARELTAASKLALRAAQARDPDALFDAGGRIYEVCRACHSQYWAEARDD